MTAAQRCILLWACSFVLGSVQCASAAGASSARRALFRTHSTSGNAIIPENTAHNGPYTLLAPDLGNDDEKMGLGDACPSSNPTCVASATIAIGANDYVLGQDELN